MIKFNIIYTYILYSLLIGNFCYGSTGNKAYKIIVIGEKQVGKTSLITQLFDKEFQMESIATTSLDKRTYEYKVKDGVKYNFDIWDTIGQDKMISQNKIFHKNANGIMAVYNITDVNSFKHLENIINSALEITGKETPVMIVANKSDLFETQEVEQQNGENLAKKYNGAFYVTSATTLNDTYPAFEKLFDIVMEDVKQKEEKKQHQEETAPIQPIDETSDDNNNHNTYKCCWCC